jgi:hypothetical protein
LADANESRDWRIYADFAQVLIAIARPLYAHDPNRRRFGSESMHTMDGQLFQRRFLRMEFLVKVVRARYVSKEVTGKCRVLALATEFCWPFFIPFKKNFLSRDDFYPHVAIEC